MREAVVRAVLAACLLSGLSPAHAENSLQGLEMDVMEPGETAAHATARIVLPRPASLEGGTDYTGLDAEQRLRGGAAEGADRDGIMGVTGLVGDASPGDPALGRGADPGGDSGSTEDPIGQPGD